MEIIVIINGVETPVQANIESKLIDIMSEARKESNNTGRPILDWDIYTSDGVSLNTTKTINSLRLADGERLFMNLGVGAGG